jgi:WD40 repeat protein
VRVAAFTNDGQRIVTGSDDETLRLWNAADGALIAEMTEHARAAAREPEENRRKMEARGYQIGVGELWPAFITSIAVAPNGDITASGSRDGRILLWDGRTGAFLRQLAFPGGFRGAAEIFSVAFSPDGRLLLSTSVMGGCMINEVASGTALGDVPRKAYVRCNGGAAFSPHGRFAAAGSKSRIQLLDARTGKLIRSLDGSGTPAHAVGFAQDGLSIAWGDHGEG